MSRDLIEIEVIMTKFDVEVKGIIGDQAVVGLTDGDAFLSKLAVELGS